MFAVNLTLVVRNATLSEFLHMEQGTRAALLLLNLIMFFVGIIGNSIVLVGSLKFRAIKMDQCSRTFLENIALADLLIIVVKVLPRVTVLAFNGWQLGKVICFASVVLKIPLLIAESLVTTGMACYRLHVLRTIVNIVRLRTMQIFILVTWCFAISYISILVGADMVGYFDPYLMGCGGWVPDQQWRRFQHTAGIILSFVPVLLIIITNIWILCIAGKYARKRTGQLVPSRSAVTMVACICWAFIISWVPYLAIWVCKFLGLNVPPVYRSIAEHAITINAIINPFIYTATNNTFRLFLKDLLCGKGVKHKESFKGGSLISQSINSRVSNAGEGRGHNGPAWFVMEIRNAARKLSSVRQSRDEQGEKLRDVRAGRLENCGLEEDTGVVC